MATAVTKNRRLIAGPLESLLQHEILVASLQDTDDGKIAVNGLKKERFRFNGTLYVILHSDDFIYNPEESHSPGSKAIYLAKGPHKRNSKEGFLIQLLPPHSITSRHFHQKETEIYFNLEGTCFLSVEDKEIILNQTTYSVKPLQIHQLRTKKHPALNLLWIKGSSVEELKHFYV